MWRPGIELQLECILGFIEQSSAESCLMQFRFHARFVDGSEIVKDTIQTIDGGIAS